MRARDNPFAPDRVLRLIRYRLAPLTWPQLLEQLAALHYRAAIVGPEGSGKTTLLEDLAAQLAPQGWTTEFVGLYRHQRVLPAATVARLRECLSQSHLLMVDGAEQLSRWHWWRLKRLSRRAGGLVITSHRAGQLPTLIECATTPALLTTIIADLTPPGGLPVTVDVPALLSRHHGNLRDALRELYDLCAAVPG